MSDNGLKCPLFVLDCSVITDVLNGNIKSNKLFKEILRRKNNNLPIVVVTNMSSLLRGISLSNNDTSCKRLKILIDMVKIYPSNVDFKDGKKVTNELLKLTKLLSEGDL